MNPSGAWAATAQAIATAAELLTGGDDLLHQPDPQGLGGAELPGKRCATVLPPTTACTVRVRLEDYAELGTRPGERRLATSSTCR